MICISHKVYPYVCKLTHKETGHFYFGCRCANKVPSDQDLGKKYKTSGKITNKTFNEFSFEILAEFSLETAAIDAFRFEQKLIFENKKNPLILNKHYQKENTKVFINNQPHTKEVRDRISEACKIKSPEIIKRCARCLSIKQTKTF